MNWQEEATRLADLELEARALEPLAPLTTFRIGGPAGLVGLVKNVDDARRFLDVADKVQSPWTCMGSGSNILADDAGYDGVVLLVRTEQLQTTGTVVRAGAGWNLDELVAATLESGLTGLEFASGIPGTLGGAVVGNAGCYGHEIGDFVREATVLKPDGRIEVIGAEAFGFAYRTTQLKEQADVVLDITLDLARGDLSAAAAERAEHLADRRRKHPVELPCAGSYFKNLPPAGPGERRRAAGKLLEAAGAKSMRVGDAAVYTKHANIIVNHGQARSSDVLRLAELMKAAVHAQFGVRLEEEVRHLKTPGATPGLNEG